MGMQALEASPIFLDVGRYLFTFPNMNTAGFSGLRDMSFQGHIVLRQCQVVLLYYFAAVVRFRSERFWWMRQRAIYMFDLIFESLKDKCEVCTGMARQWSEEEDP